MRIAACIILLCALAVYTVHLSRLEARILRADPDALMRDSGLRDHALRSGKILFRSHCAGCHGQGKGDPARGVPDLTDGDWLYGTGLPSEIERITAFGIRSHHPRAWNLAAMPAYAAPQVSAAAPPPLSPDDIDAVVEYLFAAQGRPAQAAAATRGAAVFADRGGCYDCHGPDAKGDSAIGAPNLTDSISLYGDGSRRALFVSIAYGRQGMCPGGSGRLSDLDIRETALYVYSLSHGESSVHAGT